MRRIVYDRVAWSVGLSVTLVNPAKTVEPIEMPFELRTRVGPWEGAILRGKGRPTVNHMDTAVVCAKTAEPIKMPFGCGLGWAQGIMC